MTHRRTRISIVTPCLNRAAYIGEAIESVLAQHYSNFEHIIVDGISTDGTLEILKAYPHLKVVSEPDKSLYDALNKGLKLASGEAIGHLNSDDVYAPGIFERVGRAFENPEVEAVYGGAEVFEADEAGNERLVRRFAEPREIELSFQNVTYGIPITNARFFRRTVYDRVGYTDLRYRIAADRDFLFRVALENPKAVLLEEIVYRYRMHSGSLTINADSPQAATVRAEYLAIAEEYLAKVNLPATARHWCRRWHQRETAQGATRALLGGKLTSTAGYAIRGFRQNMGWPIMFARHFAGALLERAKTAP